MNETVIILQQTVKKQKPIGVHREALHPLVVDDLPGHDADDLHGVREADPGQVRAHCPGQALAPQLCPLCGLRLRPQ